MTSVPIGTIIFFMGVTVPHGYAQLTEAECRPLLEKHMPDTTHHSPDLKCLVKILDDQIEKILDDQIEVRK